ncbi:helix-turn-helix domain-containing protein [Paenisporosarcina cavernae]|nr:helix-turn-helix transcriptional regulator [Paenisporosarcina cavernae]
MEFHKEVQFIDPVEELVQKLVVCRKMQGLTQKELAVKCGLQQTAIARIETGSTVPRLDTFMKIANALELKPFLQPNTVSEI